MAEIITALDIGASKIVALTAKFSRGGEARLEVLTEYVGKCEGISNGCIMDLNRVSDSIKRAVGSLGLNNLSASNFIIGLSGKDVGSSVYNEDEIDIAGKAITKEHIEEINRVAGAVSIPSMGMEIKKVRRSYYVDGRRGILEPPIGIIANKLGAEFYAAYASVAYMRNMSRVLEYAGVNVAEHCSFVPSSMASALAVLGEEEKTRDVAVVDMGHGTLDLAVYSGGQIVYSNVLDQGGRELLKSLTSHFNITERSAYKLLFENGMAGREYLNGRGDEILEAEFSFKDRRAQITLGEFIGVLEEKIDEFLLWIKKQLKDVKDRLKVSVSGLVITGGLSMLRKLSQKTKRFLSISDPHVVAPCPLRGLSEGMVHPIFSTSVGLLICGIEG
ncbi:cell division protein FtsA [bacterium]|nr:cell division protein FtsA [bacterium]